MGKASRTKAERRETSLSTQRSKAEKSSWVFPAAVGAVIVVGLAMIVFMTRGSDGPKRDFAKACMIDKATGQETGDGDPADLVGKKAPNLSGENCMGGGKVSLDDMRGKPTMLVFWANWCPHCQKELPIIQDVYTGNRDRWNVFTVGTAIGSQPATGEFATPADFMATEGMTMPTILDPDGKMFAKYNVSGFPQIYFIDSKGVVKSQVSGEHPKEKLEEEMGKLK